MLRSQYFRSYDNYRLVLEKSRIHSDISLNSINFGNLCNAVQSFITLKIKDQEKA